MKITKNIRKHHKNHSQEENEMQCMYAEFGNYLCLVTSYKLYVSKCNNNCEAFLQRPVNNYELSDIWYCNSPLDMNTIGNMFKDIFRDTVFNTGML